MAGDSAQTAVQADPLRKALTHTFAVGAIALPAAALTVAILNHEFALDFHHAFLPAARAVLRGVSPYSAARSREVAQGMAFLYPPLGAYLIAPFTLLPALAADILATVLVAAAVPATLLLLGVRDWRCHAIAFLWVPTYIGIQTANVTLPMVLGLALVWRYRDRRIVAALVMGLVVALKLLFWPLFVWLVATRRYRTALSAAIASALFVAIPWAGMGFAGLSGYPHLLERVSRLEGPHSYSVAALLDAVLPSWTTATAVETAIGSAVLLLVLAAGRRGRDRDAFALAIIATLALTPLLEMHYLAALLVVVALYRRRLDLAWATPVLIWGAAGGNVATPAQMVHVLVVAAATVAFAMSDWGPRALSRAPRPEIA